MRNLTRHNRDIVKPLDEFPSQTFLDVRIQLFQLIVAVLEQTGAASVRIATFSSSEEFLLRMLKLRERGLVTFASLLTDNKSIYKTLSLHHLMTQAYDEVLIAPNHSKFVLVQNERHKVAIVTSQNQTRGDRLELSYISTDAQQFDDIAAGLSRATAGARHIDSILRKRDNGD